jgi:hypothetical protein
MGHSHVWVEVSPGQYECACGAVKLVSKKR